MFYTLISHTTNAHAVRDRPTLNSVERCRNGSSIHEFYSRKASKIYKVKTFKISSMCGPRGGEQYHKGNCQLTFYEKNDQLEWSDVHLKGTQCNLLVHVINITL